MPAFKIGQRRNRAYSLNIIVIALILTNILTILSFLGLYFSTSQITPAQGSQSEVKALIQDRFLYDVPHNRELEEGAAKGIVSVLDDRYSEYFSAEDKEKFDNELNKNYEGVGIVFDFSKQETEQKITVSGVLDNSPAKAAGVEEGYILIAVNSESIQGQSNQSIISNIRGEAGTSVKLSFLTSDGTTKDFQITRSRISQEVLTLDLKDETAVIKLTTFGQETNSKMAEAVKSITDNENITKVILDLQDNTGGLLDQAVEVTSYFLPTNTLVVQEKGKNIDEKIFSKNKNPNLINYPVNILINRNTASASEIVASAIEENKEATQLIGQKSFGKGVVQQIFPLSNGDAVKLTIAEWLTPKGNKINENGLEPDIKIAEEVDVLEEALKL